LEQLDSPVLLLGGAIIGVVRMVLAKELEEFPEFVLRGEFQLTRSTDQLVHYIMSDLIYAGPFSGGRPLARPEAPAGSIVFVRSPEHVMNPEPCRALPLLMSNSDISGLP
jgi:hypothetical protein